MKTALREATRYAAVSACALIIDITVFFVLVHNFSWWYVAAASTSFVVGLLVAYALSVTLVFEHRRLQDPCVEFASFAGIGAVGVAINAAAVTLGVKVLGLHYLFAKCGAASFTFVWNFLARRQFLFAQRSAA